MGEGLGAPRQACLLLKGTGSGGGELGYHSQALYMPRASLVGEGPGYHSQARFRSRVPVVGERARGTTARHA